MNLKVIRLLNIKLLKKYYMQRYTGSKNILFKYIRSTYNKRLNMCISGLIRDFKILFKKEKF